jgi:hypothetical protein
MMGIGRLCIVGALTGGSVFLSGQTLPEPRKQFGASVTGAFEGWYENADSTRGFLVGYYSRNTQEELDVPIGPDNRIEPGGPDMGQPTHFLPSRQFGMFAIPVPKGFTPDDKLVWTIFANGKTTSIPLRLHQDYLISPFSEISVNNTPPVVKFEENGAALQGPVANLTNAVVRTISLSEPLAVTIWVTDDMKYPSSTSAPLTAGRPPVTLVWTKYRGPGRVTFDKARPAVEPAAAKGNGKEAFSGKATTKVKFSEPGEYVLHVTVNDYSGDGGGGFQCCWTTGLVKVTVKP